jgi:hypothetical protein
MIIENEDVSRYLEILSYIENSSNVEGVFFIKVAERVGKILWFNLPNAHKDELMIRVTSQEHGKQFSGVFQAYITPIGFLTK